jgi:hypothetical protein
VVKDVILCIPQLFEYIAFVTHGGFRPCEYFSDISNTRYQHVAFDPPKPTSSVEGSKNGDGDGYEDIFNEYPPEFSVFDDPDRAEEYKPLFRGKTIIDLTLKNGRRGGRNTI